MLTMQDALLRLTEYWASHGCLIAQPMNTEVGAGTLNPATALRVLGPEPWRVAYVEPSVRPDDSRYGENPNRIQTHTQFQVILKPEPGNPQELYLDSLKRLGIDLYKHDVRFVEDNWASPALGAWGLGWEVWLDGLEITQFTYFQQSGGMSLDPVSVELTYGMERIVMALNGVTHFKDICYAPGISYGEAFGQAEYEMSRYYLDEADIVTNRVLFDTYAAEAKRMIEARLPVPAHTYVLKCSHAFNVLDARGAISTTERANAFSRMRSLAQEVALLWVERRKEMAFPLGVALYAPPDQAPNIPIPAITAPSTLAFEIGVEEMPPTEVDRGEVQVRMGLTERLGGSRLGHGDIRVVSTPRRIVAIVEDVQPAETDYQRTVRGPRASVAYDEWGQPTGAAHGFARSQGVAVADLVRLDDGEFVGMVRSVQGRPAAEVLAEILPQVVAGLHAERSMRWSAPGLSFTRPIRWVTALLGDQVVPFTQSTLVSGRATHMHRKDAEPVVEMESADTYLKTLTNHGIIVDPSERRATIVSDAVAEAGTVGGWIDTQADDAVITEVMNLVEQGTPILGKFNESYLELPDAVLTTVMKKHQRYLPVRDAAGELLPYFIAVANGKCDKDTVRAGNEAVLRARFEDASFFWRHDLDTPLEEMRAGLSKLTFANRLGSMGDRADRISRIAVRLADRVTLTDDDRKDLVRAGQLAKFDLNSQMVVELSSLAGTMAREYARRAGEAQPVARALYEMELPRHATDVLPTTMPGALLALADRFDLLAGLFAIGSVPTGSSDPFGLRRAALGVIAILLVDPRLANIGLNEGLSAAAQHQPAPFEPDTRREAYEFVIRRLEQHLLDAGHAFEVVRAVLPLADTPRRAEQSARELAGLLDEPQFQQVGQAMQRVRRILPVGVSADYDAALLREPAELDLRHAVQDVTDHTRPGMSLTEFTAAAVRLAQPVDRFFIDVLVMADDTAIRNARLGLLASVRDLGEGVLDWSALP